MINVVCRKCGSIHIRKNGITGGGAQKYHCKTCNFYGTLDTQEEHHCKNRELIKKLLAEGISQCGIARMLGVSRNTVISVTKETQSAS